MSGVTRGEGRLNPDETTIADVFKSAGYATGAFGKWHNGTQAPYHPNDRGFDKFYGFTSGHWGHYFSPPLDHNRRKIRGTGYVIDDFTTQAMQFISENRDQPFFCYLPYNTPHSPMMVSDEFYDKFRDFEPEMRNRTPKKEDVMMTRAALAMCENIDWNVGRLLAHLESLALTNDTIVIYFSDNGPNSIRWNGDMKGRKGAIDEGGLRSPFLIRWPAQMAGALVPCYKATRMRGHRVFSIASKTSRPVCAPNVSAWIPPEHSSISFKIAGNTTMWRRNTHNL